MNKTPQKSPTNNGGNTDYYAIPEGTKTLNDLIEFKRMMPWMHEIFKAVYAFDERSRKAGGFDPEREINKIIYYAERGRNIIHSSLTVLKPIGFSEMTTGVPPAKEPSVVPSSTQKPSPTPWNPVPKVPKQEPRMMPHPMETILEYAGRMNDLLLAKDATIQELMDCCYSPDSEINIRIHPDYPGQED